MMFRRWGLGALTMVFGCSLLVAAPAEAARSVASGKQVKSAVRPAAKVVSKKRIAASVKRTTTVAAAPVFRPPKPPAQRHYAVDGSTFYADGVRVRAAGLDGLDMNSASGMAKQRLQQLLDSGRVSIEPLGSDGGDVTLARVRVDGRELSELISAR